MRVVLAGASGLLGPALVDSLRASGHEVLTLVRREPSGPDEARWDPAAHRLDPAHLASADAVVCLSGAGVADKRWTESYKKLLVQSRVDSVGTIARTMAGLAGSGGPQVLISASAVGYYGDTGDRETDESSEPGDSFLAGLCVLWEDAAQPAVDAGIRVTFTRTGLVVAKDGGLLQRLRLVVKAGIGGRLGSGKQYMPWISRVDEIRAIEFLLGNDLPGPVNLTAPTPARNAEFTRALGRALHRPTLFVVPGFAARIALGEFAWNVLTGQNAVPRRLLDAGFVFEHTDLEDALRAELA